MADPAADEAELVTRAQTGDRGAVEVLLARHLPGLEAYVRLRAGRAFGAREAVSDLVQSTCRDLLSNLDSFKHGGDQAFRHWLYATAARKIADKFAYHMAQRRELRREGVSEAASVILMGLAGRDASPTEQVAGNEFLERLQQAFDELSEREREVVLLSRVVGLSRSEVAAAMGESEGAVRNLLHRTLAKLAGRLGT
jgi:RNA polymerase sigma-70 factor, ECF subfamily